MADDDIPAWKTGAEVLNEQSGYASTFGDQGDRDRYAGAIASGATPREALQVGDNGIGSNDLGGIRTPYVYGVAVPRSELERYFGYDPQEWRRARVAVRIGDSTVNVPIVDEGPGTKAQAHGVVTDLSASLAEALKANGMEPAEINILRDAGPDYMSDRASWDDEQKRIRSRLGVRSSWQDGVDVDRPEPTTDASWKSGTVVSDERQPAWQSGDIATNHPVAQAAGMGATSWITKIWDQAKESMAKAGYGSLEARTTDEAIIGDDQQLRDKALAVRRGDPYEKQIQDIQNDQFLNQQQKDEAIAVTRGQQAREQAKLQAQLAPAKQEFLKAEAQVKTDKPNLVESIAGQTLPYLWFGTAGGPAAPFLIAQQATAETYGDMLDGSVQKLRKDNPSWSDSKVMIEALKATQQAAQASAGSQLAMAVLPEIPVLGSLASRIVKKIGIGAATMEIANAFAEVQKNMAIREHVDPKQDILGQLRNLDFHLTNLATGGAFSVGHALAEIGRPTTKPIDQRIADAQKIEQNLKKPTVQPDTKASVVEENGEAGIVPSEPGAERPETADTGRPGEGKPEVEPVRREREPGAKRAVGAEARDQRRWAELKPEEVQDKMMEWRAAFDAAWVKYAPFFKALRVEMLYRPDGGIGVSANHSGVISLEVNPMAAAEQWHRMKQISGSTDLAQNMDAMLRHELIHGAWMDAWRQQWVKEGSQGGLNKYLYNKSDEINQGIKQAIAEARANHNEGLASYLEQAAIASEQTYSPTKHLDPFARAAEFIRQMVEARHNGVLTEDYFAPNYNRFLATVKHAYAIARAYLTSLAQSLGLTPGKGLDPLRNAIHETEKRLAEIGFLEDREPVTPEDMLPEEAKAGLNPIEDKLDLLGLDDTPQSRALAERAIRADTGKETILVPAVRTPDGRIIASEFGHDAAAKKAGVPRNQVENAYLTNTGRFVDSPMDLARQIEESRAAFPSIPNRLTDAEADKLRDEVFKANLPFNTEIALHEQINEAVRNERRGGITQKEYEKKLDVKELKERTDRYRAAGYEDLAREAEREAGIAESPNVEAERAKRFLAEEMETKLGESGQARASFPGEELFEANRDVIKQMPHGEDLTQKLYDYDDNTRDSHGKIAVLTKMFKVLSRQNRNLPKEIDDIGRYVEENGKLPPMSAEAAVWLSHANNGLYREFGKRMRDGGFMVRRSDGSLRPFIGAPEDVMPMPRIMRPNVQKVLSGRMHEPGTTMFTKEAQAIYDEGTRTINKNTGKPFFQKPEDFEKWAKVWSLENKEDPMMTNLERAREVKYPTFFYTYSPQAMIDRLFWQAHELARLETFGQKLTGPDLFDRTFEKINADLTLTEGQKKRYKTSMEALRRDIYGLNRRGTMTRIIRGLASFGYAASPHTSSKIGLSMLFNIPALRGLARTLYAIDQITSPFSAPVMLEQLRQAGLKQDIFVNITDDPYTTKTAENRATNFFTGGLRIGLHAFVQDVAKAVTYKVSRMWLESAIRKLRADPGLLKSETIKLAQDIQRRGIDPKEFLKPVVPERLKERFAGEDVQQLQTAYRPHDYPAWWSDEKGSIMVTFGHWAYDRARVIARDAVIPMVQAFRAGDLATPAGRTALMLGTRYFGRLLGIALVSAGGASEAWRQVNELFGREDNVATIAEILKALHDRNPDAFHMITSRLTQDIVLSPVIGLYSDVWQRFQGISRGTSDLVRTFNPFQPAPIAYLAVFQDIANAYNQQGHRLSNRQMWYYGGQLVSIAKGYYDVAEAGMHIPLPGTAEARGHREYAWVRSRVNMFYDLHPEFDKTAKGIYPSSAHASYLQNISEALLAGNVQDAKDEIHRYHVEQKLTEKQLRQSLESSLRAHEPIPGGKAGASFRVWAKKTLPADEWEKMQEINKRYLHAAHEAGVPIKP